MRYTQFLALISTMFIAAQSFGQCVGPSPDLGQDTTVCTGQSIILNPGTFSSYLWNNGSTQPTRSVNQAGTYWVTVGTIGANLIVNGDFEQGNTAFTTDYVVGTGGTWGQLSSEGTYAITTSPNAAHSNFSSCADHTPNPGTQMMVVNGSGNPNTDVWCQTVPVNQNTDYQFSTWASSALNDPNVAQLQFSINGNSLGAIFSPPATGCSWTQFYQTWNSGMQVSAQICIVNQNIGVSGNDFMIDDISFAPLCYETDSVNVSNIAPPVITATPNDSICVGEIATITASSSDPNLTYTWNPGAIVNPTLSVSPATSTFYNVSAVSPQGCVSNLISRLVYVSPSPTVSLSIVDDTLCFGDQADISATATGTGLTYSWTPNLSSSNQLTDIPTASQNYSVIVENNVGCEAFDTVQVTVIPPLDVQITGDLELCEGEVTSLTATGNLSNMTYAWSTGSSLQQIAVNPSSSTTYVVTASLLDCDVAQDSVLVTVHQIPTVSASEDQMICPGEEVNVSAQSSVSGSTFSWMPFNLSGNNQTYTFNESTYVYVVANNQGCLSSPDSLLIDVSGACFVEVPNVFTPNADGSNDWFALVSFEGIESLSCTIVNRWGNTIQSFDTPNFAWDGRDKSGIEVEEGVYFYVISGKTNAQEEIEKQGFVQLVRN